MPDIWEAQHWLACRQCREKMTPQELEVMRVPHLYEEQEDDDEAEAPDEL